jgi:hypothetical protein
MKEKKATLIPSTVKLLNQQERKNQSERSNKVLEDKREMKWRYCWLQKALSYDFADTVRDTV